MDRVKRACRRAALIHSPPAKHAGVITSQATGTSQGTLPPPAPNRTTIPATQVATESSAQRIVSSAMMRALAIFGGSPASRSAQKSTDKPPIAVATLNAPNDSPTTRTTVKYGKRGPPSSSAIA